MMKPVVLLLFKMMLAASLRQQLLLLAQLLKAQATTSSHGKKWDPLQRVAHLGNPPIQWRPFLFPVDFPLDFPLVFPLVFLLFVLWFPFGFLLVSGWCPVDSIPRKFPHKTELQGEPRGTWSCNLCTCACRLARLGGPRERVPRSLGDWGHSKNEKLPEVKKKKNMLA